MTAVTPPPTAARVRRSPADRYDERREQLAESALKTLGELGYARASLRDIATNSPFSHGVLHYYFDDKLDLIDYCIRSYKAKCVTRYDSVIADSATPGQLREAFAAKLVETIVDEGPMHRLWYDVRAQSMFEQRLRPAVTYVDQTLEEMVWRVVERYAELSAAAPALNPAAAYGMLDGLFHAALLGDSLGEEGALDELVEQVHGLLPLTIGDVTA
jgi:TetR/AcrR family transcriptional repressor of bet genes